MTNFDYQPILTDGVVRLRPLRAQDWDVLYGVARDPAIWAVHPNFDRWQEDSFRDFFDMGLASGGALIIEDALTGAVIGSSRYDRERVEDDGEVEIGWTFLARKHWGGATNAAVKRLMIDHALATWDKVIFLVGETNLRSRRAMEKIGGTLTSRIQDTPGKNRTVRHVIYMIDCSMFQNSPLIAHHLGSR